MKSEFGEQEGDVSFDQWTVSFEFVRERMGEQYSRKYLGMYPQRPYDHKSLAMLFDPALL